MNFRKIDSAPDICRVENGTEAPVLDGPQAALDILAQAQYGCGCHKLVILKKDVDESFFDLKTKIAGDILQKFTNYGVSVAFVGDFSGYKSNSLRDFMYESNQGRTVFFVETEEEAVRMLER